MSNHSFDILIATEYKSTDIAILVWHFQYWIIKNKRLNRNVMEGRTWTYQTIEEIAAVFPYWSFDQVRRLLKKCIELKILVMGNFNKAKFDRTMWYAFENEEKFAIWRFRQMEVAESPHLYQIHYHIHYQIKRERRRRSLRSPHDPVLKLRKLKQ